LRITTGASRKPWVQGFVEQARNALYSYLHHLRSFHSDSFNWAELLPSVTYMHNTAVQTQKSELPMLQLDGRDNRLANANTLMTYEVLQKDEYRRHFNASFGTCFEQHQQTNDGLYNSNNDSDNRDGSTQGISQLTNTYEARQQRAAADNTRAVQRNQHRMDKQTAQEDVPFTQTFPQRTFPIK
jgi:hypothetical protein